MVAVGKRRINDGKQYDKLFPMPDFNNTIKVKNGDIEDTMVLIGGVLGKYYKDTEKIAPLLKGNTLYNTCNNIFDFVYNNIQYQLDKAGEEQLRRPARSWQERKIGVDCDCYSIFIGSILMNLKIPFKLRITKYNGNPHFQHVYIIVPKTKNSEYYYIIDCVLNKFNYEKIYSYKKDYTMESLGIPVSVLSGTDTKISNERLTEIFNVLKSIKEQSVITPDFFKEVFTEAYLPSFLQMLDYAIDNFWKSEEIRNEALKILAINEEQAKKILNINSDYLINLNEIANTQDIGKIGEKIGDFFRKLFPKNSGNEMGPPEYNGKKGETLAKIGNFFKSIFTMVTGGSTTNENNNNKNNNNNNPNPDPQPFDWGKIALPISIGAVLIIGAIMYKSSLNKK